VLRRAVEPGPYEVETIAEADDGLAVADGETILTFRQAQERARTIAAGAKLGQGVEVKAIKVSDAIAEYVAICDARERRLKGEGARFRLDAKLRLDKHVLRAEPILGDKPLIKLVSDDLAKWRKGRGDTLGETSIRRVVNDFKAALNMAALKHRKRLPGLLEEIKAGFKTTEPAVAVARDKQILPDADIRRILTAAKAVDERDGWEGNLLRFVAALAVTGARFSQIARQRVADAQPAQSRLMVPVSAKGRGEKKRTHTAVAVGADVIGLLWPAVAGRKGQEPLFLRPRWRQGKVGNWVKVGRGPWRYPSELTRPWSEIIAEDGLPVSTVPYVLRHSSIARSLRAHLPVRLVAAQHDTSAAMIEKHYAAYIVDAMDELAARAVVPLVTPEPASRESVR
jgi:integrase